MNGRPLMTIALTVLTLGALAGCVEQKGDQDDGMWDVDLGTEEGHVRIRCEPAITEEERRTGLMGRDSLGGSEGMVFVFDPPENVTFWMKDTKLALDIIFIAHNRTIVLIAEMGPGWGLPDEEVPYCTSPFAVSYVVEVARGSCRRYGVVTGSMATVHVPG